MTHLRVLGATTILFFALAAGAAAQIAVDQTSEKNKALVNQKQTDDGNEKNRVFTTGNDGNSVTHVQQRGTTTDPVSVTQTGDTNIVRSKQNADNNSMTTIQTGDSNTATIRQIAPE